MNTPSSTDPDESPSTTGAHRSKEERRAAILYHAARLFDTKGYSGTTTQDIADAAKITKRTLYRYMPSKEDILFEIHARFLAHRGQIEMVPSEGVVKDAARFMTEHIRTTINRRHEIRVFFDEMKHLSPAKREEIAVSRAAYEQAFVSLLERGSATGELNVNMPPIAARLILGGLNEIYHWYSPTGSLSPSEIENVLVSMILDGISVKPVTVAVPDAGRLPEVRQPEEILGQPMVRIWRAAVELFSCRGYQDSGTEELAEAAGVTKGALFYHIHNKEEMLYLVQRTSADEVLRLLDAIPKDSGSAAEVLGAMAGIHVEWYRTYRGASAVASEEAKHLSPEHSAEMRKRQETYSQFFRDALIRGQHRDEFSFADVRLAAALIAGMLNSLYRWYRPDGPISPLVMATMAVNLFLNGIRRR